MDFKEIITAIAEKQNIPSTQVEATLKSLAPKIRDYCCEMDTIAIPGFGTFQPVKSQEEIRTDLSTGSQMLFPPSIEVEFKTSVVLRKRLSK